ncbi:ATP synthase subunit I [Pricia sp. S334]|uniref:ATP synthase subunit I n=1 Tax=Pricia mediterranea TaxID=3076079 RepID=A0ABU3L9F7_9FLAO|nr:ATP synthase subunit I [Pricia sp. S334]MDT7829868.1 ATP synthase subunit I [Pricia sp. S334]
MNEILGLLPAVLAGAVLGTLFFGGLWVTIRLGLRSNRTGLIFAGSAIIRMAMVVVGFYYVGANSWQKMLACLGGFLIARIVITRITQKQDSPEKAFSKKIGDET